MTALPPGRDYCKSGIIAAMRHRLVFPALLLMLAAIPACESPLGPGSCEELVRITVDQGGGTVFDWEPECSVDSLLVRSLGADGSVTGTVWEISFDNDPISPPVSYGTAPAGTKVRTDPVPLEPGREYRISIFRISGISIIAIGAEEFTFTPPSL